MAHITPGDDDERRAQKADDPPLEDERDGQREPQEQPEQDPPRRIPVRESEWGFLARALARSRRRPARREEQVMGKARSRTMAALAAGAVAVLAALASGCGGDDGGGGGAAASEGGAKARVSTIKSGVLTVGSDVPFPPFEFRKGGELTGFDVDVTEEMARRLGLRVEWVDTSFDTLFTQVAAGRFDMAAAATTITPERAKQVRFTEPYYAAQQALTVNKERSPGVASVDELSAGDVVAVQTGTTGEAWARENVADGVEIRAFPEAPDIYTALEAGAVEAVIMDEPSAVSETATRKALAVAQTIDTQERYGFAVDPRNADLLDALNGALADMQKDGTYQRIYDRYEDLPPKGSIASVEG
jgi:polar amino acid transport system substrate-binding protein